MACINPDGTVTKPARATLNAVKTPATAEEVSKTTGYPLYRVRSVLRELLETGLAEEKDGMYNASGLGLEKINA